MWQRRNAGCFWDALGGLQVELVTRVMFFRHVNAKTVVLLVSERHGRS
jgi:hypothetical protein